MSLEPTAPRPAPAFTADEERLITGRPFLVPLYVPHFTARSLPARMLALFTGVRGRLILGSLVRLDAPVAEEDYVTMYVILWRFRPMVGQESEFERAYGPLGSGHSCSAVTTTTSAPNFSGAPTTNRESTSPWTAGPLVLLTKPSEPAGLGSIGDSTVGWKSLLNWRVFRVPSRCSLREAPTRPLVCRLVLPLILVHRSA